MTTDTDTIASIVRTGDYFRASGFRAMVQDANIDDLPDTAFADEVVAAADQIDGFRYQIQVSNLARKARALIGRGRKIKDHAPWASQRAAEEYTQNLDVDQLGNLLRWSDSLRVSRDIATAGKEDAYFWMRGSRRTGFDALRSLATESLKLDTERCVLTGGYKK